MITSKRTTFATSQEEGTAGYNLEFLNVNSDGHGGFYIGGMTTQRQWCRMRLTKDVCISLIENLSYAANRFEPKQLPLAFLGKDNV